MPSSPSIRTSRGVNRSGITSLTSQGSHEPMDSAAAPATKAIAGKPGANTKQTSHSAHAASSAWAMTTGQSVTVI